jgi:tight adherence protein C
MKISHFLLSLLVVSPVLLHFSLICIEEFRSDFYEKVQGLSLRRIKNREREMVESEFPLIVELFAILISGGMSPSTALARISERGDGQFISLLRPLVDEMRNGLNLAQALDILNRQVDSAIIRRFCDSLAISIERGSSLIDVVGRHVEEVRQAQRILISDRASKAEIALMVPIVFLILPISILFALWPSYYSLGNGLGGA